MASTRTYGGITSTCWTDAKATLDGSEVTTPTGKSGTIAITSVPDGKSGTIVITYPSSAYRIAFVWDGSDVLRLEVRDPPGSLGALFAWSITDASILAAGGHVT